jgi:hypothetical protein
VPLGHLKIKKFDFSDISVLWTTHASLGAIFGKSGQIPHKYRVLKDIYIAEKGWH